MPSPQHRYHFPNLLEAFFIVIVLFFTEYLMNALIWKLGRQAGLQTMGIYSIGRVLAHGVVFTVLLHHAKGTYRELVHENPSSWQATLAVFAGAGAAADARIAAARQSPADAGAATVPRSVRR